MIRLNKFLAEAGIASRRKCDEIISQGKVTINGQVASLGTVVDATKDIVIYNGNAINAINEFVYLKMNKPKGFICSANDDKGRKTVYDLLPKSMVRVFTVGRLDYDTEGLLLFTNDGHFDEKISHPKYEVKRIYTAKVEGKVTTEELAKLRQGAYFDGEKLPDAKVEVLESSYKFTKLQITIDEGKNHQIKNMFEAIGRNLIFLKRTQIGEIKLGSLDRGQVRSLTKEEIDSLK